MFSYYRLYFPRYPILPSLAPVPFLSLSSVWNLFLFIPSSLTKLTIKPFLSSSAGFLFSVLVVFVSALSVIFLFLWKCENQFDIFFSCSILVINLIMSVSVWLSLLLSCCQAETQQVYFHQWRVGAVIQRWCGPNHGQHEAMNVRNENVTQKTQKTIKLNKKTSILKHRSLMYDRELWLDISLVLFIFNQIRNPEQLIIDFIPLRKTEMNQICG